MAGGGVPLLTFRSYEMATTDLMDMLGPLQNRDRTASREDSAILVVHLRTIAKDLLEKHQDRSGSAKRKCAIFEQATPGMKVLGTVSANHC